MLSRSSSGRATTLILCAVLCAGVLAAIWSAVLRHPRQPVQPRLIVLQANAISLSHAAQFIALTNGAVMNRGKRFASWQLSKYRGLRFPVLSQEITVAGLANLYRSVDALSPGVMIPLEFFELKACFPTNCVLTNAQTSLPVFRRALEESLCHNGVVGVRDGPILKLVKREWVQMGSAASPHSSSVVQPNGLSQ